MFFFIWNLMVNMLNSLLISTYVYSFFFGNFIEFLSIYLFEYNVLLQLDLTNNIFYYICTYISLFYIFVTYKIPKKIINMFIYILSFRFIDIDIDDIICFMFDKLFSMNYRFLKIKIIFLNFLVFSAIFLEIYLFIFLFDLFEFEVRTNEFIWKLILMVMRYITKALIYIYCIYDNTLSNSSIISLEKNLLINVVFFFKIVFLVYTIYLFKYPFLYFYCLDFFISIFYTTFFIMPDILYTITYYLIYILWLILMDIHLIFFWLFKNYVVIYMCIILFIISNFLNYMDNLISTNKFDNIILKFISDRKALSIFFVYSIIINKILMDYIIDFVCSLLFDIEYAYLKFKLISFDLYIYSIIFILFLYIFVFLYINIYSLYFILKSYQFSNFIIIYSF